MNTNTIRHLSDLSPGDRFTYPEAPQTVYVVCSDEQRQQASCNSAERLIVREGSKTFYAAHGAFTVRLL